MFQKNNPQTWINQLCLLQILIFKSVYKITHPSYKMSSKANFKVYMDVQIGASGAGRIVFQLFNDLTPKTSQNFRGLCTGQYGRANNTKLHYLNTKFHRIIDGFVIQGGDVSHSSGKGGFSIYGRTFNDESFARTHSCAGLLSMANCGRNTNSSQFFITLKAAPHLDSKHVVFGQVIDGMQVVRKISKVPIDKQDKPRIPVIVVDCGQVGDYKAFLKYDPFKKQVFQQIRQRKQKIIKDQYMIRKLLAQGMDTNEAYQYKKKLEKCERELMELGKQEQLLEAEREEQKLKKGGKDQEKVQESLQELQKAPQVSEKMREKFGQSVINKFLDLKLKINQAKVLNSKAALQQEIRQNDTNYHKMIKKQQWLQKRKHAEQQIESKGISKNKLYLNRNALKKDQDDQKKDTQQQYGWNVYTEDAYYSAHEKRCGVLAKNEELNKERELKKQNQQAVVVYTGKPSQQALNRLQADIVKQQEKRSFFSRKRLQDQDQNVNYINEKNKVYNQKLQRNFKTYASAIRTSLEMNSQKN